MQTIKNWLSRKQIIYFKMSYKTKQKVLKRWNTNGWEICKMFDIMPIMNLRENYELLSYPNHNVQD